MVGTLRIAATLTGLLWSGTVLSASIDRIPTTPQVRPFQVTIKSYRMGPRNATRGAISPNISAYLLGDAPDPSNPVQDVGFIAQHATDGSTTYYMPSINSQPDVAISAAPNLSWKVNPCGISFTTPGAIDSGRLYVVDGHLDFQTSNGMLMQPDPHNPGDIASKEIWGFIELTHTKGPADGVEDMTVNLSFVDWVSLPLGMNVTFRDGDGQKTVYIPGLKPDGLSKVCETLSGLGSFWPNLCIRAPDQTPLRVMSPTKYVSLYPNDDNATEYYEPYISKVWEKYKNVDLKINTQSAGPGSGLKVDNGTLVTCRVGQSDNILHCDHGAGDFDRPVSSDIYGCNSGPFGNPSDTAGETWSRQRVRPRLCAAFVRSTLHLDGAQPSTEVGPSKYYQDPITNHYARVVHDNLIGGMGYAFSYDDVNPGSTENLAGLVSMTHPIRLDVFINT